MVASSDSLFQIYAASGITYSLEWVFSSFGDTGFNFFPERTTMKERSEGADAPELRAITDVAVWMSSNYSRHVVIVGLENI